MSQLFDWVAIAFFAGLIVAAFVSFRTDRRWWLRPIFAFGALALLVAGIALTYAFLKGTTLGMSNDKGYPMLITTVLLWFGVIRYAQRPLRPVEAINEEKRWGCFRTMFAILGCAVVGYIMFVLLVMGLGLLIGLFGQN